MVPQTKALNYKMLVVVAYFETRALLVIVSFSCSHAVSMSLFLLCLNCLSVSKAAQIMAEARGR